MRGADEGGARTPKRPGPAGNGCRWCSADYGATGELDVAGRCADVDRQRSAGCDPPVPGSVPIGQRAAVQADGDPALLPGPQVDACPPGELFRRGCHPGRQLAGVDLRQFGSGAAAGVAQRERHGPAGRVDPQVAVAEGGVGQAVAERVLHRQAEPVVAAVTDEDALAVDGGFVDAGESLRALHGDESFVDGEGDGQLAGGVDVAEQDPGDGVALFLAAVPGLQDGGHPALPGVGLAGTGGGQHDDGVPVGGCYFADELGLVVGQVEEGAVAAFGAVVADDHDGQVRASGEVRGGGDLWRYGVVRVGPAELDLRAELRAWPADGVGVLDPQAVGPSRDKHEQLGRSRRPVQSAIVSLRGRTATSPYYVALVTPRGFQR